MNQHVDMARFIEPKSDQLNSDDLIGGPLTIRITGVSANEGSPEQPISVSFEGDNRKPYKPCKSMRRVMVHVWGPDAKAYVGRSMTLYRDPEVQFGGMKVGGIRISHMSHIDGEKTMALTATRAKRAPFKVRPLKVDAAQANEDAMATWVQRFITALNGKQTVEDVDAFQNNQADKLAMVETQRPELFDEVSAALDRRRSELSDTARKPDDQFGEGFTGPTDF